MRSSTVTSLFKEFSLPVIKLENGYKGYRQYLNENLPKMIKEKETDCPIRENMVPEKQIYCRK